MTKSKRLVAFLVFPLLFLPIDAFAGGDWELGLQRNSQVYLRKENKK